MNSNDSTNTAGAAGTASLNRNIQEVYISPDRIAGFLVTAADNAYLAYARPEYPADGHISPIDTKKLDDAIHGALVRAKHYAETPEFKLSHGDMDLRFGPFPMPHLAHPLSRIIHLDGRLYIGAKCSVAGKAWCAFHPEVEKLRHRCEADSALREVMSETVDGKGPKWPIREAIFREDWDAGNSAICLRLSFSENVGAVRSNVVFTRLFDPNGVSLYIPYGFTSPDTFQALSRITETLMAYWPQLTSVPADLSTYLNLQAGLGIKGADPGVTANAAPAASDVGVVGEHVNFMLAAARLHFLSGRVPAIAQRRAIEIAIKRDGRSGDDCKEILAVVDAIEEFTREGTDTGYVNSLSDDWLDQCQHIVTAAALASFIVADTRVQRAMARVVCDTEPTVREVIAHAQRLVSRFQREAGAHLQRHEAEKGGVQ